jgi:regulatory protein
MSLMAERMDSQRDDDHQAVTARALRMLARREHSAHELCRKLVAKGHAQSAAQEVMSELRAQGLQSDERFTEMYVRSRVSKGNGPIRIRQDLYQRGLDDELIDAELTCSAERWIDLARSVRCKRFSEAEPSDRDGWNTQARFLARRGFPADIIYRVLGQI